MMTTQHWFGGAPADIDDMPQLGEEGYEVVGMKYAQAYRDMLERFLEASGMMVPVDFFLVVEEQHHDFGTYYEVVCRWPSNVTEDVRFLCERCMLHLDWHAPTEWDEKAKQELGLA